MGYFDGLFPDEDGDGDDESTIPKKKSSSSTLSGTKDEPTVDTGLPKEGETQLPVEADNPKKTLYMASKADLSNAISDTLKAINREQQSGETSKFRQSFKWSAPLGYDPNRESKDHIDRIKKTLSSYDERSIKSDPAILLRLADDLNGLGAKLGNEEFLAASKKLANASKAQAELNQMRASGGALTPTKEESSRRLAEATQKLEANREAQKTAGAIRMPELKAEEKILAKTVAQGQRSIEAAPPPMAQQPSTPMAQAPKPLVTNPPAAEGMVDGSWEHELNPDMGASSAGVSKEQFRKETLEGLNNLKRHFGPDFNQNEPIDASNALPFVIQMFGPEAMATWSEWASRHNAEKSALQGNPQEHLDGKLPGSMVDMPETQLRRAKQQELANARYQLMNTREFNSWPSIVAFVLMSIWLGPDNAFRMWDKSRQRGTLRNWIAQLDDELRQLQGDERDKIMEIKALRREAMSRYERQQDREEDFSRQLMLRGIDQKIAQAKEQRAESRGLDREERDFARDIHKIQLNHNMILARIQARGGADEITKKLSADYNRAMRMMKTYQDDANNPYAPSNVRDVARREYAAWLKKALEADETLQRYGEPLETAPQEE
jgi:hypothetical protein